MPDGQCRMTSQGCRTLVASNSAANGRSYEPVSIATSYMIGDWGSELQKKRAKCPFKSQDSEAEGPWNDVSFIYPGL